MLAGNLPNLPKIPAKASRVSVKLFFNSTNNSIEIECKEFVKYLGVLIHSNLTWKYHIDNISSKIRKAIYRHNC